MSAAMGTPIGGITLIASFPNESLPLLQLATVKITLFLQMIPEKDRVG